MPEIISAANLARWRQGCAAAAHNEVDAVVLRFAEDPAAVTPIFEQAGLKYQTARTGQIPLRVLPSVAQEAIRVVHQTSYPTELTSAAELDAVMERSSAGLLTGAMSWRHDDGTMSEISLNVNMVMRGQVEVTFNDCRLVNSNAAWPVGARRVTLSAGQMIAFPGHGASIPDRRPVGHEFRSLPTPDCPAGMRTSALVVTSKLAANLPR